MTRKNKIFYSLFSVMLMVCMLFHFTYPTIVSTLDNGSPHPTIASAVDNGISRPTVASATESRIYVEDIKIYECEDDGSSANKAKRWF